MGRRQRRRNRQAARQHALSAASKSAAESGEDVAAVTTGEATERLAQLVNERRQLDIAIDCEIDQLVAAGVAWPVIATALGVTRQAVRQRHQRRAAERGRSAAAGRRHLGQAV